MTRIAALALAALLGLAACGSGESPDAAPEAENDAVALPDVARIVCQADGPPLVETPAVRPQPDGVHLEIVNETGKALYLALLTMGSDAPAGTSNRVLDAGPGALTVSCYDALNLGDGEPPSAPLEVVDEDGVWVSTQLGCEEQFSQVNDYAIGARGETSDPLEAARSAVEGYGLEPDDVFESAGYPEDEVVEVRLVRADETLAVVFLVDDGAGKWLVGGMNGCSSLES